MNGNNDLILDIVIYSAIALVVAFGSVILVPIALVVFFVSMVAYFVLFFLLAWLPFVIIGVLVVGTAFAFAYVFV